MQGALIKSSLAPSRRAGARGATRSASVRTHAGAKPLPRVCSNLLSVLFCAGIAAGPSVVRAAIFAACAAPPRHHLRGAGCSTPLLTLPGTGFSYFLRVASPRGVPHTPALDRYLHPPHQGFGRPVHRSHCEYLLLCCLAAASPLSTSGTSNFAPKRTGGTPPAALLIPAVLQELSLIHI